MFLGSEECRRSGTKKIRHHNKKTKKVFSGKSKKKRKSKESSRVKKYTPEMVKHSPLENNDDPLLAKSSEEIKKKVEKNLAEAQSSIRFLQKSFDDKDKSECLKRDDFGYSQRLSLILEEAKKERNFLWAYCRRQENDCAEIRPILIKGENAVRNLTHVIALWKAIEKEEINYFSVSVEKKVYQGNKKKEKNGKGLQTKKEALYDFGLKLYQKIYKNLLYYPFFVSEEEAFLYEEKHITPLRRSILLIID
jgi:hypothetical protein